MQKENFSVHGAVTLVLQRKDGACIASRHNNMVLNSGIDFLCNAFGAGSARPNAMSHIAVGTGTTAVAAGDTKLATELLRKAASYSHSAGTTKLTIQTTFNAGEAMLVILEFKVVVLLALSLPIITVLLSTVPIFTLAELISA